MLMINSASLSNFGSGSGSEIISSAALKQGGNFFAPSESAPDFRAPAKTLAQRKRVKPIQPVVQGYSHDDLVDAARAWLNRFCAAVITEMATAARETPDAIGWRMNQTTLIECKTSRADFLADRNKAFRVQSEMGAGNLRYFLACEGLIQIEELPANWGLLEVRQRKIRKIIEATAQTARRETEACLLLSALRRIGQNPVCGVSVQCFTIETQGTATISSLPLSDSDQNPPKASPVLRNVTMSEAGELEAHGMRPRRPQQQHNDRSASKRSEVCRVATEIITRDLQGPTASVGNTNGFPSNTALHH